MTHDGLPQTRAWLADFLEKNLPRDRFVAAMTMIEQARDRRCAVCETPLSANDHNRYCSDACKSRAKRQARAVKLRDAASK